MAKISISVLMLACLPGVLWSSQLSQPPAIQWQRSFGGTNSDEAWCVRTTSDGGYVVAGASSSPAGGNKTSDGYGRYDFWVLRLDSGGNKLWERSYGGSGMDYLDDMVLMPDGGMLLGGFSDSDVSGNKTSPGNGLRDFWIVRIDASGTKMWERSYGTTNMETLRSIQAMPDGGFVLAGHVSRNSSVFDLDLSNWWVLRIDATGNVIWQRTLGGSEQDQVPFVRLMPNGDLCLAGQSTSPVGGDKTSPALGMFSEDYWLVRLDGSGTKLWDRSYGGNARDYLFGLEVTSGGGLLLGGTSSSSPGGNKSSPLFGESSGFGDYWVVRMDGNGNRLWEKSFGGSQAEIYAQGIQTVDGGYVIGGSSGSPPSGNKTSPLYNGEFAFDYWILRLDEAGNKVWEETYGGTGIEAMNGLAQTPDGGFILVGNSASPADGNKTTPAYGQGDYWIIKLAPDALAARPRLKPTSQAVDEIRRLGYRMALHGLSNRTYAIEFSTNMSTWSVLLTNRVQSASSEVVDAGATNSPGRFYRARLVE